MTSNSISLDTGHGRIATWPSLRIGHLLGFFLASRFSITILGFQSQPVAATAVVLGFGVMLFFLIWMSVPRDKNAVVPHAASTWVAGYLTLAAISILWSASDSTMIATAYWIGMASDCASVYLLCRYDNVKEAVAAIMNGFVVGAAFVGAIAWMLPTMTDLRIGDEDLLHPNGVAYLLALATMMSFYLGRSSRFNAWLGVFCGLTLLRTISKASIAAFFVASALYLLRASHLKSKQKIAIGIAVVVLVLLFWGFIEAYFTLYDRESRVETLTGRTYIWEVAWEEAVKTPWLGHGFYSFRYVIPVLGDFAPWQAHNEPLQQFFCYGILGFSLFIALYTSVAAGIRKYARSELASIALSILVYAIIRGIADTERFDINFPLWLITLFSFALPATVRSAK